MFQKVDDGEKRLFENMHGIEQYENSCCLYQFVEIYDAHCKTEVDDFVGTGNRVCFKVFCMVE